MNEYITETWQKEFHESCISCNAATILTLLGVEPDSAMEPADQQVLEAANGRADRVFMYNPDAIGHWVYKKYEDYFEDMMKIVDLERPRLSVMPSVTPVAFASMYSGLQPEGHGIQAYVKPVLTCKTVFDMLADAGKKVAIVSTAGDSISVIFLERNIDYYIYPTDEECNEKALELIEQDEYDFIVLYNPKYDTNMHKVSPEGTIALEALQDNIKTYITMNEAIKKHWKGHKTVMAFAPDHGCHKTPSGGSHGTNEPCDMNVTHFYSVI